MKRDGENLVLWPSLRSWAATLTHSTPRLTIRIQSPRMSSLFGNRAGAVSSPSDSAAKAQQIKQEVAQQLGTLPISLYAQAGASTKPKCTALANAQELINVRPSSGRCCVPRDPI